MKNQTCKKHKAKGNNIKVNVIIVIITAIFGGGCSTANDYSSITRSKLISIDTPLLANIEVHEMSTNHVTFDALGGRVEVIEPKSRSNGYMLISPYMLTEGLTFQIKEKLIDSQISTKLKAGQIYDREQISDAVIDLALKRVSLFIDAEKLPYNSLTIIATIHGYADGIPFKLGASIPSPISCDFSLMNASIVDHNNNTSNPVTVVLKKGDAITNNNVLAMVRSCYVAKQLQSRATNALYPAFVTGSFKLNLVGHTDTLKRGVDVFIKLKSPDL